MSNVVILTIAATAEKTVEPGGLNETSIVAIVVAILSLIGSLVGSFLAQRKTTALVAYRLEQLEKKVDKHNNVVERMYKLEERQTVSEQDIKVANHRIEDLEREVG